jgi:hypothetical protein
MDKICKHWQQQNVLECTHLMSDTKANGKLRQNSIWEFCLSFAFVFVYLLTYSMEQSPSWESNRFSASQEIPRILWFITAFTRARHLSLSWASSIQSTTPHPTSWRSILYYPPIYAWVSQVVSFPQVSPPNPVYASPLTDTRYIPHPSNFSRFDHPNNIGWGVQIIQLLSSRLIHIIIKYQPAGKNNTGRFLQSLTDLWSETGRRPGSSGAWWWW